MVPALPPHEPRETPWARAAVRCPQCGLVLTPRALVLVPLYCPRCLALLRRAVQLEPMARVGQGERAQADRTGGF
jgi:phage FluMu protein Com